MLKDVNESIPDFLSEDKSLCCGCEACAQICPRSAIGMDFDEFGFRYPIISKGKCIHCGLCKKVCPLCNFPLLNQNIDSYGGYINDEAIRRLSTSGGAFSALVQAGFEIFNNSLVVFGAVANGLDVQHEAVVSFSSCAKFYSSKYVQSKIDRTYIVVQDILKSDKHVLFSGTPCQIAGLTNYLKLRKVDTNKLISIEVLCAGVATPILFKKYDDWLKLKFGSRIRKFYWRYKDNNRWDFNCCKYELLNGTEKVIDRWFSGYWSMFTQRLLMRPSCENCPYKGKNRVGDITLGDLWGVDKECPILYDNNRGTSWILVNSDKGKNLFEVAKSKMTVITVKFDAMKKYQIPSIEGKPFHPLYKEFMNDLKRDDYQKLCNKWAKKPSMKLLFQKYIYNNRAKVWIWKLKKMFKSMG